MNIRPPSNLLTPVRKIENYAVIMRCRFDRGAVQEEAMAELERRGLTPTPAQLIEARK